MSEVVHNLDTAPPATEQPPDLDDSELYANRELSWLDFNERVLELAEDERMPLLERVKFLAIYTSNLDEFFMVRVAGLHDQVDAGIDARGADGLSPYETVERINERTRQLAGRKSRAWREAVRPELAEAGIRVVDCADCDDEEIEAADQLFAREIFPVLTPLAVGPGRPFPYISNLSLSLAVWLRDPVSDLELFARVKVPKEVVPRFLEISPGTYVTLEDVIARHLDELFPGMEILRHDVFRVTRDADFTVSDEADDLLQAVEYELRRRRFGEVVRLEIGSTMDDDMRAFLVEALEMVDDEVVVIDGLLDMVDLWEIHGIDGHNELRDRALDAGHPAGVQRPRLRPPRRVRRDARARPAGAPPVRLVRLERRALRAAGRGGPRRAGDQDDRVPHLGRLGPRAVADRGRGARQAGGLPGGAQGALRRAAQHRLGARAGGGGRARGARLPGLKTHAKALLVVRREGEGVRHYVHVGTGNYHAKTARLYEDFGLFTADRELTADVAALFNALTGAARLPEYRKSIVAPEHMRGWVLEEIEKTVEAHRRGEPARIVMKMNSLVDARCIRALYRASQAGVPVDLSVRGICCLRAGVPGVSENIRVVSVVGRFLEHSRVYSFHRGDEHNYWLGSADLMPRNLDTRVELLVPVEDESLQAELQDTLDRCLADDTFAWELRADGSWERAAAASARSTAS